MLLTKITKDMKVFEELNVNQRILAMTKADDHVKIMGGITEDDLKKIVENVRSKY